MIESAARAERFQAQAAGSSYYVWEVPQKPVSVRINLDVVERLEKEVVENFRSINSRGSEIGGILLGNVSAGSPSTVVVEEYELVLCDYARGPLYRLSDDDMARFDRSIAQRAASGGGLAVLGYFRSHTRKGLSLDTDDVSFFTARFREARNVLLLVRPFATKASTGGIFIWENGTLHSESSYLEFPFVRAELAPKSRPSEPVTPIESPAPIKEDAASAVAKLQPRAQIVPIAPRREAPPAPSSVAPAPAAEIEKPPVAEPPKPVSAEAEKPVFKPESERPNPFRPIIKQEAERSPAPKIPPKTEAERTSSFKSPVKAEPEKTSSFRAPVKQDLKPELKSEAERTAARPVLKAEPEKPVSAKTDLDKTATLKLSVKVGTEKLAAKPEPIKSDPAKSDSTKSEAAKPEPVKPAAKSELQKPAAKSELEKTSEIKPAAKPDAGKAEKREEVKPAAAARVDLEEPVSRKRSGKLLWIAVAAVGAFLTAGVLVYPGLLHHGARPGIIAPQDSSPLALRVERTAGELLLTWNRDSDAIRTASKAVLSISDGDQHENVDLDLTQLRNGSVVYSPSSSDVSFRLEVTGSKLGTTTSESVRVLRTRPSPMPDNTQPPADATKMPPAATSAAAANSIDKLHPSAAMPPDEAAETQEPVAPKPQPKQFSMESLSERLRPARQSDLPEAPNIGQAPTQIAAASGISFGGVTPSLPAPPPAPRAVTPSPSAVRAGGQIRQAEVIYSKPPEYPALARQARITGTVTLQATVGADGRVKDVKILRGHPLLQKAAIDAVKQWVYRPALLNGSPVDQETQIVLNFMGER
ncbi:MAG TPA: TonB family protein [Bryobacteraceae bacterium]|nr:TonB family protein [Bryobacteraceae bacterium]